jgi:hypothetical protein
LAHQTDQSVSSVLENAADELEGFAEWLEKNPEPSLQELVECYGGFSRVPVEAWQEFDRRMEDWKRRYLQRHLEGCVTERTIGPSYLERCGGQPTVEGFIEECSI